MIYTIGYKPTYEEGFELYGKDFKKLGIDITRQYLGGSVWRTKAQVQKYLDRNMPRLWEYGIYGVKADWKSDTWQVYGEPFRRLIKTSLIIKV